MAIVLKEEKKNGRDLKRVIAFRSDSGGKSAFEGVWGFRSRPYFGCARSLTGQISALERLEVRAANDSLHEENAADGRGHKRAAADCTSAVKMQPI